VVGAQTDSVAGALLSGDFLLRQLGPRGRFCRSPAFPKPDVFVFAESIEAKRL